MPTYDYACDECGHQFELFQSISEKVKRKCPACGRLKLRRLFGAGAAVVFKGSGFYQTDYRSEGYKKAAAADSSSGTASSSSSSSTSTASKKTNDSKSSSHDSKSTSNDSKSTSSDSKPGKKTPSSSAGKS
jgi:putative FmdB family regulatory protein